jgi:hypothetical protein
MSSDALKPRTVTSIAKADEKLLAKLGYKQEFQRAFTPLEVFYVIITYVMFHLNFLKRCSVSRLASLDSCPRLRQSVSSFFRSRHYSPFDYSSVLFYSVPNGGPVAMVWGVSLFSSVFGLNLS